MNLTVAVCCEQDFQSAHRGQLEDAGRLGQRQPCGDHGGQADPAGAQQAQCRFETAAARANQGNLVDNHLCGVKEDQVMDRGLHHNRPARTRHPHGLAQALA